MYYTNPRHQLVAVEPAELEPGQLGWDIEYASGFSHTCVDASPPVVEVSDPVRARLLEIAGRLSDERTVLYVSQPSVPKARVIESRWDGMAAETGVAEAPDSSAAHRQEIARQVQAEREVHNDHVRQELGELTLGLMTLAAHFPA
nr:Unknown Function [uncultured bacterium]